MKAGKSFSLISTLSRTCGKILPKATCLRRFDAYHSVNWLPGKLACLGRITIWNWAIQHFDWVWCYPEMSRQYGNFWPLSSGAWVAAGGTQAANVAASANCILKPRISSHAHCPSQVTTGNSSLGSLYIPVAASYYLASSCSFISVWIRSSILVWLLRWGRNCFAWRSMRSVCNAIIGAGWLHNLCTSLRGAVYWGTHLNAYSGSSDNDCIAGMSISSMFLLTIYPMIAWSYMDTRYTWSCWFHPDIATMEAQ